MAAFYYADVIGFCSPSSTRQNLSDAIMGAPKGAANQLANVLRTNNRVLGPTGDFTYGIYNNRFIVPTITIVISGSP